MKQNITKIISELAKSFLKAYQAVLTSDVGINNKTNTNTLVNSNMFKQATTNFTVNDDAIVNLLINDYEIYVQTGRKSKKLPPLEPLIIWAKSKGIPTDNNTMWAIRKSIAEKGIKPRPFIDYVWNDIDAQMDKLYFDRIFNEIINDLNIYFNGK